MSAIDPAPRMAELPAVAPQHTSAASHAAAQDPSRKPAPFAEATLLQRSLWTVPETAFMCRVGVRTVWRLMADPDSGFPAPRRVRGRTLLSREAVVAWLEVPSR
jgi:hypothetical protein